MYSCGKIIQIGSGCMDSVMLADFIRIWHACFGDDREEIVSFFSHFEGQAEVAAYIEEGHAVSMLCLLPAVKISHYGDIAVRYIYAVGTLPDYRGKGYCSRLLSHTCRQLSEKGERAVLVPADKELISFYEKQGFHVSLEEEKLILMKDQEKEAKQEQSLSAAENGRVEIPMDNNKQVSLRQITAPGEYTKLRDKAFAAPGYIRWDEKTVSYAVSLWYKEGGSCCSMRLDDKEYGILYKIETDGVLVKEITAGSLTEAQLAVGAFMKKRHIDKGILCRSACVMETGNVSECRGQGYFNLTLS